MSQSLVLLVEAFCKKEITLCGNFKDRGKERLLIEEGIDNDKRLYKK